MNLKASRTWTALACSAMISLSSVAAFAQDDGTPNGGAGVFSLGSSSLYSTVIGLPLTTTGGVVLIVVLVANNSNSASLLQKHLEDNKAEVHAALYTGETQSAGAQDLAYLFGVSARNQEAFAAILHEDREILAECIAGESISKEQAFAFGLHIANRMQAHPELAQDVDFQLARHAAQ